MKPTKNQRVDKVTGEVTQLDDEQGQMVVFNPENVVTSLEAVKPEWTHAQKVAALASFTEAITAPSVRIDDFLNSVIKVVGAFQHEVQVNNADNILIPAVRTVIMVEGVNGEDIDRCNVSMVSTAVWKVFATTIIPLFGAGVWEEPVYMKFRKVPTKRGSTFSIRVMDGPRSEPTGYSS
jgi:hypothetical protein